MAITSLYLPNEGLQGERIPSFIIWDKIDFDTIHISFGSPLILEEVYNSSSWEVRGDKLVINNVECDGYLGLSFISEKSSKIIDTVSLEYLFTLKNGELIKETRKIELFKPKLEVKKPSENVIVNFDKGFTRNKIKINNIGKGTQLILLSTPKDSSIRLETPFEYRDFIERFSADLKRELDLLKKEFPQFQSLINESFEWDEKIQNLELSESEKEGYRTHVMTFSNVIANNITFLQSYAEAFVKALIKNSEFIQFVGRFIQFYESIVAKNIMLLNPFDRFKLTKEVNQITLEIKQTDKVYDEYEDITLTFGVQGDKDGEIEINNLFDWG